MCYKAPVLNVVNNLLIQAFRLLNMLDMAKVDVDYVWKTIKETRLSFLSQHLDSECQNDNTLLSDEIIQHNMNSLSEKLKLGTTSIPNRNSSYETLQTAAEMFTYLNFCPPMLMKVINHMIVTGTPQEIILGFTTLIKTTQNAGKIASVEVFLETLKRFNLNHYEEIQYITKEKCYNGTTFGKCIKKMKLDGSNKDLKKILGFLNISEKTPHTYMSFF